LAALLNGDYVVTRQTSDGSQDGFDYGIYSRTFDLDI